MLVVPSSKTEVIIVGVGVGFSFPKWKIPFLLLVVSAAEGIGVEVMSMVEPSGRVRVSTMGVGVGVGVAEVLSLPKWKNPFFLVDVMLDVGAELGLLEGGADVVEAESEAVRCKTNVRFNDS